MTQRASILGRNTSQQSMGLVRTTALPTAQGLAITRETRAERPHANVLGIRVEAVNMVAALTRIEDALVARKKGYVCLAGVHGIMEAQRNPAVKRAFADAFLTLPDGTPTAWVGRLQGLRRMRRLTGPDLMLEIFRSKKFAGYSHFLYGGKPGVAEELALNLSQRFPWVRIAGTYTPPFHDLTRKEASCFVSTIRMLKPHMIWVGISTPRQEMFMRRYLEELDTSLMFGVGAAFDFHTGRIKDCAEWIKRAGLQWLHRLLQDPRHLLWRYARNNPMFIWQIVLQLTGVRMYEAQSQSVPLPEDLECGPAPDSDLCTGDEYG